MANVEPIRLTDTNGNRNKYETVAKECENNNTFIFRKYT